GPFHPCVQQVFHKPTRCNGWGFPKTPPAVNHVCTWSRPAALRRSSPDGSGRLRRGGVPSRRKRPLKPSALPREQSSVDECPREECLLVNDADGVPDHRQRMNATRSFFSSSDSFSTRTMLKNSTVSSRVRQRPSCRYGGLSLMPRS